MLRLWFKSSYQGPELECRIREIFCGNAPDAERVAGSSAARVFRFSVACSEGARTFFYKEFLARHLRDRVATLFRRSRARRAARGSQLLLDRGFCAAVPICVGEQLNLGVVRRNFLVTEALDDAISVMAHFKKHFRPTGDCRTIHEKRQFLSMLGRKIGSMHRSGIIHGDLRLNNIIVKHGSTPDICLIDNERTRGYKTIPARDRLRNLVQVNMVLIPEITVTDRIRFFRAYLEQNPDLVPVKKVWMRRILRRTRQRLIAMGLLPRS